MYFIGAGEVFIANRDANGNPKALDTLFEVPILEVMIDDEYVDVMDTTNVAQRDAHILIKRMAEVSLTLRETRAAIIALVSNGRVVEAAAGSVANALFPTGILAGETHQLPGAHTNVALVTIMDSAGGGGVSLVAGTDYVVDPIYGTVKFLNVTGKTQPFKTGYNYGASSDVVSVSEQLPEKFLFFKGVDLQTQKPVLLEIYRVSLKTTEKLQGKGSEVMDYSLRGAILIDKTKPKDGVRAQMYRMRFPVTA